MRQLSICLYTSTACLEYGGLKESGTGRADATVDVVVVVIFAVAVDAVDVMLAAAAAVTATGASDNAGND